MFKNTLLYLVTSVCHRKLNHVDQRLKSNIGYQANQYKNIFIYIYIYIYIYKDWLYINNI